MNICIFCSAADVDEKYAAAAREFAELLAKNGHTLVWGGTNRGLMRTVAETAQRAGARIVGISMELLKHRTHEGADEMIIEQDLVRRKATMLERSGAFVALVGGVGTLDELGEILALKTHRLHERPIVVLDTDGFYRGLRMQFETMNREGFLHRPMDELVFFATTPSEAIEYIETHYA